MSLLLRINIIYFHFVSVSNVVENLSYHSMNILISTNSYCRKQHIRGRVAVYKNKALAWTYLGFGIKGDCQGHSFCP